MLNGLVPLRASYYLMLTVHPLPSIWADEGGVLELRKGTPSIARKHKSRPSMNATYSGRGNPHLNRLPVGEENRAGYLPAAEKNGAGCLQVEEETREPVSAGTYASYRYDPRCAVACRANFPLALWERVGVRGLPCGNSSARKPFPVGFHMV